MYDIREQSGLYYVDTILDNGDRLLGQQQFHTKEDAEAYVERRIEESKLVSEYDCEADEIEAEEMLKCGAEAQAEMDEEIELILNNRSED